MKNLKRILFGGIFVSLIFGAFILFLSYPFLIIVAAAVYLSWEVGKVLIG